MGEVLSQIPGVIFAKLFPALGQKNIHSCLQIRFQFVPVQEASGGQDGAVRVHRFQTPGFQGSAGNANSRIRTRHIKGLPFCPKFRANGLPLLLFKNAALSWSQ